MTMVTHGTLSGDGWPTRRQGRGMDLRPAGPSRGEPAGHAGARDQREGTKMPAKGEGRATRDPGVAVTVASSRIWRGSRATVLGPGPHAVAGKWRREGDSNPWYLSAHTISSRAPSTTRSPLPRCCSVPPRGRAPFGRSAPFAPGVGDGLRPGAAEAERRGFEPRSGFHLKRISNPPPSTTRPSLQNLPQLRRRPRKKPWSRARLSSAKRCGVTLNRWFNRASCERSPNVPRKPPFGSGAPHTHRCTRACTIAPAHIAQGSSVT